MPASGTTLVGSNIPAGRSPDALFARVQSGERERRVESYVLDRSDLELYGAPIAVDFVARIRGQVRFEGVGALIVQIQDDVRRCHQILGA